MSDRDTLTEAAAAPQAGGWVRRSIFRLSGAAGVLGSFAIVVITLGLALDVLLRTIRGQGIPGMLDAIGPLLVVAAFLGLGITEAKGEHIALTLFVRRLSARTRAALYIVGTVATMLIVTWMIWTGLHQAVHSIQTGEVRPGIVNIPLSPARVIVVIGCVILLLQLSITLTDAVRSFIAREPKGLWIERENE